MSFLKTVATLAAYATPFRPWCPSWGSTKDADCIFCQAFGRNRWADDELGPVLRRLRAQARWDDRQTLLLLKEQGFDPGDSNRALAEWVRNTFNRHPVAIMAQWEVAFALFERWPKWYLKHHPQIDCLWPRAEGYFSTYHVNLLAKERMLARGCKRPLEVAHPAMLARAVLTIWKTGVRPVVARVRFGHHENSLWVWDKNSVQPWTRSFGHWWKREMLGRAIHVVTHVLPFTYNLAPARIRTRIPGNWIRFTPPRRGVK